MNEQHTDAKHAEAEARLLRKLGENAVPEHLHGGLIRYLLLGILPGHFLTAVLMNNLAESFARADETSRAGLFNIVQFLYSDVPATAWGSEARVRQWVKDCTAEREKA